MLLVHYKIPSIFISTKPINETRFNNNEFVCYTTPDTKKYVFIIVPPMFARKNIFPVYSVIIDDDGSKNISLESIDVEYRRKMEHAIDSFINIEKYVDDIFKPRTTSTYIPKKNIRHNLIIEESSDVPKNDIDIDIDIDDDEIIITPKKRTTTMTRKKTRINAHTKTNKRLK